MRGVPFVRHAAFSQRWRRPMNVFEFLALLLIVGGIVFGVWHASGSWLDLLWSGLAGAAKGYGIFVLMMLMVLLTLRLALWYRPQFPRCRNGRCGFFEIDYVAVILPGKPWPENHALPPGELARCRCGILYLRPGGGCEVAEVDIDGNLRPWMRHRPWGRWRPIAHNPRC